MGKPGSKGRKNDSAGKAVNIAGEAVYWWEGGEEGKREETMELRAVFMGKTGGSLGWPAGGYFGHLGVSF